LIIKTSHAALTFIYLVQKEILCLGKTVGKMLQIRRTVVFRDVNVNVEIYAD
jgi:hypothetical protein